MRQPVGAASALMPLAQALALSGCVGDSAPPRRDPSPPPSAIVAKAGALVSRANDCGPAIEVGSVAELAALGPSGWAGPPADWARRARSAAEEAEFIRQLEEPLTTISSDVTARASLSVTLADLLPKGNPVKSYNVRVRGTVPGLNQPRAGIVEIQPGAMFRVRFARTEMPPLGLQPQVVFEAPCRAECAAGERRCLADGICYDGSSYCRVCDKGPPERCACVARDGSNEWPGTPCDYVFGGSDLGMRGRCWAGTCR